MIRRLFARMIARHHADADPAAEARLEAAETRAAELTVRADAVATSLTVRLRHNHFAESLGIAWGDRRGNR